MVDSKFTKAVDSYLLTRFLVFDFDHKFLLSNNLIYILLQCKQF